MTGNEKRDSPDLNIVAFMYPTPTTGAGLCGGTGNYQQLQRLKENGVITEEERRNMAQGNGGQLNPDWVEWLMGFPPGWTETGSEAEILPRDPAWWEVEPPTPRVATAIPHRVGRLKALGNAVVPAQAFPLFWAIGEIERGKLIG